MKIRGERYRSVWFSEGALHLIDQPQLPHVFQVKSYTDYREVAVAIKTMVVRGAPAIGATGAYGMALAALAGEDLLHAAEVLRNTRPTAQDLFHAIDSVLETVDEGGDPLQTAHDLAEESEGACRKIGEYGADLIQNGMRLNTHCNAGWLATVDWGTATAPMYVAMEQGKEFFVFVDETRPRCQGSRLTAFELGEEGIPHAVIVDNATAMYMKQGEIDLVIVGSDRIAANGDIANKIGTYGSAVAAKENGIPFYVAAPRATIDLECKTGDDIPIEERDGREVSSMFGWNPAKEAMDEIRIAPETSDVKNPAFDVTPAEYITGIITERGIFNPGFIGDAFDV